MNPTYRLSTEEAESIAAFVLFARDGGAKLAPTEDAAFCAALERIAMQTSMQRRLIGKHDCPKCDELFNLERAKFDRATRTTRRMPPSRKATNPQ